VRVREVYVWTPSIVRLVVLRIIFKILPTLAQTPGVVLWLLLLLAFFLFLALMMAFVLFVLLIERTLAPVVADYGCDVAAAVCAEPELKHKLAPVVADYDRVVVAVAVAVAAVVCAVPGLEHTLAAVAAGTLLPWRLAAGTTVYHRLAGESTHQCPAVNWRRGKVVGSVIACSATFSRYGIAATEKGIPGSQSKLPGGCDSRVKNHLG
jgi:hypothetical protein